MADLPFNNDDGSPKTSPELAGLVESARSNGDLLASDLYTIRDWLYISGYHDECLVALSVVHFLGAAEGSLCTELSRENLSRRLGDLVPKTEADGWAGRIETALAGDKPFPRLFGGSANDDRPLILYPIAGKRFLYFQKYLRNELDFSLAFRARLKPDAAAGPGAPQLASPLREKSMVREVLASQPFQLDADQRAALELALSHRLAIISGGPGTGKTSIVLTLLRCLARAGAAVERIALAAPTGRAAQRMGDAIRHGLGHLTPAANSPDASLAALEPSTLHQLLDYNPAYDSYRRHRENPIDADLVIIDEVSMVSMAVMARLLEALAPAARLLLLGDKDQLPSVDAGAVLAHLIPDDAKSAGALGDAVVVLRTNHRSEPRICEVAAAINRQDESIVERLPRMASSREPASWDTARAEGGCFFLEQTRRNRAEIRHVLHDWAGQNFMVEEYQELLGRCRPVPEGRDTPEQESILRALFRHLEKSRLLTLVREGPWGCVECNQYLAQMLRSRLDPLGQSALFAGAPVLVTRNDPLHGLFNGDVGLTVRTGADGADGVVVVFSRPDGFLKIAPGELPAHELGFALTVHKSQGSEYGEVLFVLPPEGGRRLLTKELIYTAVTRARKLAILCATPEALRLAISRRCNREAGLLRFELNQPAT